MPAHLGLENSRRPRLRLDGVPVFAYHGLSTSAAVAGPAPEKEYWITEAQFREQLDRIRLGGYLVTLLRELWDATSTLDNESSRVVLTFDDGWASDYLLVFPLLKDMGVRADFFVNTATVGQDKFLSWREMMEMQSAGMSFQSHSHDHVDLTRLSLPGLERQLRVSRQLLVDRLGCSVDFLSAPYGLVNNRVLKVAQETGYRAICNCRCWPAQPGAPTVNRIVVSPRMTARDYQRLLARNPVGYLARIARKPLYFPRWILLRWQPARVGVRVLEEPK